ncbi:MAG: hypothetical protein AAGI70_01860 [Pseudomonadota bacterium]
MAYVSLSQPAWYAHPLNRFEGGMMGVLAWTSFQLLLSVALILGFVFGGTGWLFREEVPDLYEWVLWGAMAGGPPLIVPALLARDRWAPWIFTGYILTTFFLLLGAELFALDWFSAARYQTSEGTIQAAIFALAVSVDLVIIAYLFRGTRPNVIYHRRIRDSEFV